MQESSKLEPSPINQCPRFSAPVSFLPRQKYCEAMRRLTLPLSVALTYFLLDIALELPTNAVSIILNKQLQIDPDQVTAYYALMFTPWSWKPLFGFFSDILPIGGYRRIPYIVLACVGISGFNVLMSISDSTYSNMVAFGLGISICEVLAEVLLDSIVVELSNRLPVQSSSDESVPFAHDDHVGAEESEEEKKAEADYQPLPSSSSSDSSLPISHPLQTLPPPSDLEANHLHDEPSIVSPLLSSVPFSASSPSSSSSDYSATAISAKDTASPLPPATTKTASTATHTDDAQAQMKSDAPVTPREELQARLQSEAAAVRTFGSVVASAMGIGLHSWFQPRTVLWITAIAPALALMASLRLPEKKGFGVIESWTHVAGSAQALKRSARFAWSISLALFLPLLFVFLCEAGPSATDAFDSYLYDNIPVFADWEYNLSSLVGLSMSLIGSLVFWRFFTGRSVRFLYVLGAVLGLITTLSQLAVVTGFYERKLGLSAHVYVPMDSGLSGFLSQFALMAPLVLAARLCPKGLEGSLFALFSSMAHVASLVSASLSIQVTRSLSITSDNWRLLWLMIVIGQACSLVPFVLLPWISTKPSERLKAIAHELQLQLQQANNATTSTSTTAAAAGSSADEASSSSVIATEILPDRHHQLHLHRHHHHSIVIPTADMME